LKILNLRLVFFYGHICTPMGDFGDICYCIFVYYVLSIIVLNHTRKRDVLTGRVGIGPSPLWRLQRFVDALNGWLRPEEVLGPEEEIADQRRIREAPVHLRELVGFWQISGSKSVRPSSTHEFWREINEYLPNMPKLQLLPVPNGGATIWWSSHPDMNPRGEAIRWFVEFLINPDCRKLEGPCDRCGKYYIRKSARNKRYCSRICGTKATATAATKRARKTEHENKLERARKAIREYAKAGTKMDWKQWVSRSAPQGMITPKFLTRAVTKKELIEPVRTGSTKET
jgi:hypothetical protein